MCLTIGNLSQANSRSIILSYKHHPVSLGISNTAAFSVALSTGVDILSPKAEVFQYSALVSLSSMYSYHPGSLSSYFFC